MATSMRKIVLVTLLILVLIFETCPVFAAETGLQGEASQTAAVQAENGNTEAVNESAQVKADPADADSSLKEEPAVTNGTETETAGDNETQDPSDVTEEPVYQAHIENVNGDYYFYDETGEMAKGKWVDFEGKRYFAGSDGKLFRDQIISFGQKYYYMDSEGAMVTDTVFSFKGARYCAGADGLILRSQWVERDGKKYFAGPTGAFYHDQFISFGKTIYYTSSDGSIVYDKLFYHNGERYYAGTDGKIAVSKWVEKNGLKYFASASGAFYHNMFISFGTSTYYTNTGGDILKDVVFKYNGNRYYAKPDGRIAKSQWVEKNGNKYFADPNGAFYHNMFISFGKTSYYTNTGGDILKDIIFTYKGSKYYAKPDGKIAKSEWVEKNGLKYFASPSGAFYHNRYISFGKNYYYMNTGGDVVKTPFVLNGYTVKPNPNTGVISENDYKYSIAEYKYGGYTTYVLVNISTQTLTYVRGGRLILETPVITGMKGRYDTPKGTFSVLSKSRNVNLKGEVDGDEWDVMVDYWVAFIGGAYGFHDAGWKSGFGGNTYTWNGSHGCVNLPVSAAAKFYSEVSVGTRVFIV